MAKLCNISVRTVQFYDQKGVLHPSTESEGGRRIYSYDDLTKLRLICVLKSIGLSLDAIKGVFASDMCGKILSLLLDEQEKTLSEEIAERQKQLEMISVLKESIHSQAIVTANSILDIEHTMENRTKSQGKRKLRLVHIGVGVLCITQIAFLGWLIHLAILGTWWPIVTFCGLAVLGITIVLFILKGQEYLCTKCDTVFDLPLLRAFFTTGSHKVRWTKCPDCGHQDWCIVRHKK